MKRIDVINNAALRFPVQLIEPCFKGLPGMGKSHRGGGGALFHRVDPMAEKAGLLGPTR